MTISNKLVVTDHALALAQSARGARDRRATPPAGKVKLSSEGCTRNGVEVSAGSIGGPSGSIGWSSAITSWHTSQSSPTGRRASSWLMMAFRVTTEAALVAAFFVVGIEVGPQVPDDAPLGEDVPGVDRDQESRRPPECHPDAARRRAVHLVEGLNAPRDLFQGLRCRGVLGGEGGQPFTLHEGQRPADLAGGDRAVERRPPATPAYARCDCGSPRSPSCAARNRRLWPDPSPAVA